MDYNIDPDQFAEVTKEVSENGPEAVFSGLFNQDVQAALWQLGRIIIEATASGVDVDMRMMYSYISGICLGIKIAEKAKEFPEYSGMVH